MKGTHEKFTRKELIISTVIILIGSIVFVALGPTNFNKVEARPESQISNGMYTAKIKRWIDGDSCILDIEVGFDIWLIDQRTRLARVDTPERGQPDFKKATKIAEDTCPDKVFITDGGRDKYGRLLVEMDCNGVRINDKLRTHGWVY